MHKHQSLEALQMVNGISDLIIRHQLRHFELRMNWLIHDPPDEQGVGVKAKLLIILLGSTLQHLNMLLHLLESSLHLGNPGSIVILMLRDATRDRVLP